MDGIDLGSQQQAVKEILGILDEVGTPYMVVGSYAASFHGLSRATHDLDLVIRLEPDSLRVLLDRLGDRFYWSIEAAERAVAQADMFNAIHHDSGLKVDFWVLGNDEFAETQFSRRQKVKFDGVECWVASPEDTVLSKLIWHKISGSERQISDVQAIIAVNMQHLDMDYIRTWAEKMGIIEALDRVIEQ